MINFLDFFGRIFISALFLISAYNKILNIDGSISWMEGYGVPGFLLYPTIALEIIFGLKKKEKRKRQNKKNKYK